MLASDKLNVADETTLYHAVVRWGAAVLAEDVQGPGGGGGGGALQLVDVVAAPLRHVRLGLIDPATLHRVLRPGGLVPPERLLDAWAYQAGGAQLVDAASPQFVVRSGTRDERITKLVFESAFDTNGALHHIGTDGGQEDWANPHDSRRVVAAMSSAGNGSASRHVVTRPGGYNGMNHTLNTTNSWVSVDLGESWRLSVDHYCLRSDGNRGSHKPRNWELQGASSPAGPWTTLRRHDNDAALGDGACSVAAWSVLAHDNVAFRCFRVFQHGRCSSGTDNLVCAGIEMYGTLTSLVK